MNFQTKKLWGRMCLIDQFSVRQSYELWFEKHLLLLTPCSNRLCTLFGIPPQLILEPAVACICDIRVVLSNSANSHYFSQDLIELWVSMSMVIRCISTMQRRCFLRSMLSKITTASNAWPLVKLIVVQQRCVVIGALNVLALSFIARQLSERYF